jgi:hypothetical protein
VRSCVAEGLQEGVSQEEKHVVGYLNTSVKRLGQEGLFEKGLME